jgi:Cu+-exporting ATPase
VTGTIGTVAVATVDRAGRGVATVIVAAAVDLSAAREFEALPGHGVRASVDGHLVLAGRPAFVTSAAGDLDVALADTIEGWERSGATVVVASVDDEVVTAFALTDAIKPDPARRSDRGRSSRQPRRAAWSAS